MSFLINPYLFAVASMGPSATTATLTIAAGTVASDLTNFPVMVRLSSMPASFWSNVRIDGGDIRVTTTGGTVIPHDLARFDYTAKDGVLFFRAATIAAATSNQWKVTCGNPALAKLAYSDANGRNAVWSDYAAVLLFGETSNDRTGKGTNATVPLNGDPDSFAVVETSPSLGGTLQLQGVCSDGAYYYITYTNISATPPARIEKRDLNWNLISQNTGPVAQIGTGTANHLGDLDCHNGLLYIALQHWDGSTESGERIGIWNASDLSFVTSFDVSAQHPGGSGLTYCTADDLLYVCSYNDQSKLWKYNPTTGAYVGTLTLNYPTTMVALNYQGVQYWRGAFWLNSDGTDETLRAEYDGTVWISGLFGQDVSAGGGEYEGIGSLGDTLLVAQSRVVGGVTTYEIQRWKPQDIPLGAGGGINMASDVDIPVSNITPVTTWTMGVTAAVSDFSNNRNLASYWSSSGGATARATLAYRNSTNELGLWDGNNSWLFSSPSFAPTLNQAYRVHGVYSGTTSRQFYINGVMKNTQSGIGAPPASLNTFRLGNDDNGEAMRGKIGFAYLRPSALSAAWIAAEYANINSPSTFCTVAEG